MVLFVDWLDREGMRQGLFLIPKVENGMNWATDVNITNIKVFNHNGLEDPYDIRDYHQICPNGEIKQGPALNKHN